MYTRNDKRTYKDRSDYLKKAVTARRKKLKLEAVKLAGGKCLICGYSNHSTVLDFHHVDKGLKSFGISSGGFSRSWLNIVEEIQKCILVCANCHREIEHGVSTENLSELHNKQIVILMDNSLAPGTGFEPAT